MEKDNSKTNTKHGGRKAIMLVRGFSLFIIGTAVILAAFSLPEKNQPPQSIATQTQEKEKSRPVKIIIPQIGVETLITDLRLNKDKSLQTPDEPENVGWYIGSSVPGEIGTSILVGHLDWWFGRPAIFSRLSELKAGDEIKVELEDGSLVNFKVEKSEVYSQSDFPSQKVYADTETPSLRLITCSGSYSNLKGRYSHNLVVYAIPEN